MWNRHWDAARRPTYVQLAGIGLLVGGWAADSRSVYTWSRSEVPAHIERINVQTGVSEPWMEIWPIVRSGVGGFNSIHVTPDGMRYACSYVMIDATLFHARGLK